MAEALVYQTSNLEVLSSGPSVAASWCYFLVAVC